MDLNEEPGRSNPKGIKWVLHVTKWVAASRGILNPFCLNEKRNYLFNKKEEYFSDLMKKEFSAVITKGELYFVALCPELGVVSKGSTEKEALNNLNEAVELYLEDKDVQKMLEKNPIKKAVIKLFEKENEKVSGISTYLASEKSLAKLWNTKEENEVWKNL